MSHTFDDLLAAARQYVGEFSLRHTLTAATVAAAIESDTGKIYTGVCMDLWCGIGFCAEHAAVAEMLKARETRIHRVAAVTVDKILAPCGRCRELMLQINPDNAETIVLLPDDRTRKLIELMPEHWTNGHK